MMIATQVLTFPYPTMSLVPLPMSFLTPAPILTACAMNYSTPSMYTVPVSYSMLSTIPVQVKPPNSNYNLENRKQITCEDVTHMSYYSPSPPVTPLGHQAPAPKSLVEYSAPAPKVRLVPGRGASPLHVYDVHHLYSKSMKTETLHHKNAPHMSAETHVLATTEQRLYKTCRDIFLLTSDQLALNSYPQWDGFGKVKIVTSHYDKTQFRKTFANEGDIMRNCIRCSTDFQLGECVPTTSSSHPGCLQGVGHVFDTLWEADLFKFVATPTPESEHDWRSQAIYALDAEMVYTVDGPALARLTVIDINGTTVMDELVRPQSKIIDLNTKYSGITEELMQQCTLTLEEVQNRFFNLVNCCTILIGHSLESDLKALRVVHDRVIDTALLFPHPNGLPKKFSLKRLALDQLHWEIQENECGHDSYEDALACLRLVKKKALEM